MIFWIAAGLYLFSEIYLTCSGSIRWYFVVGVLLGGFLTIWIIYKVKKVIDKLGKSE